MEKGTEDDPNVVKVNLQKKAADIDDSANVVHKVDLSKTPEEKAAAEAEAAAAEAEAAAAAAEAEGAALEEITGDGDEGGGDGDEDDAEPTELELAQKELEALKAEYAGKGDGPKIPEGMESLVNFMDETGGTIEDYVKLNQDVDALDDETILKQYHKSLEPDLTDEEIEFVMEDMYQADELLDERDVKKKALLRKRNISKAKKAITEQKDKYFKELKGGSRLTEDQKKAVDFFNRYTSEEKETAEARTKRQLAFTQKTDKLFNEEFKGFEFKVGEKRFRFNVKDVEGTKSTQSDINNFTKKYLGDDKMLADAKGYHKALFTAMNADAIADHFYKQGQADALKTSAAKGKNIDMGTRGAHGTNIPNQGGMKAKVVASDSPAPGKLRIKNWSNK